MADFLRSLDRDVRVTLLVVGVALATSSACDRAVKSQGTDAVVPSYNAQSGRLERITYDRNKDGKPDAWLYMDGTKVTRAELDENNDGAVDRWEHYRADLAPSGAGQPIPRGVLLRAQQSTRFDGTVSRWEVYEGGKLAKVDEDTTGDGRPDKWETWVNGSLTEVALDTSGGGKPTRRIVYPADGGAPQLLVDVKGDGTFTPASQP